MYKPWIGKEAHVTGLLILGESTYSWLENGELRHPSPEHSSETVKWAINEFPNCGRFCAMISRALANEQNPSRSTLETAWNRVAFTNYVPMTVGDGSRTRPTKAMWAASKTAFLDELWKLQPLPRRVVVLGKQIWYNMPATDIVISDYIQGYRLEENVVMCYATRHPAGGLSWQQLAGIIHSTDWATESPA